MAILATDGHAGAAHRGGELGIKVAGGHTIKSAWPASAPAPWTILASSPTEAASPFIFQLPATKGVMTADAMFWSLSACGYQTRNAGRQSGWHTSRSFLSCKELARSL